MVFVLDLNAIPITVDDINFDDPWEYKILPHNEPLLKNVLENHVLPPIGSRQVFIYCLNDINKLKLMHQFIFNSRCIVFTIRIHVVPTLLM